MADAWVDDVHGGQVVGGQVDLLLQHLLAQALVLLPRQAPPTSNKQPLDKVADIVHKNLSPIL